MAATLALRGLNATSTVATLPGSAMIDSFAILLTHGLMLLAAWRLLRRDDLDREGAPPGRGIGRTRPRA